MALSANKTRPIQMLPGGLATRALEVVGFTNGGAHTIYKGSLLASVPATADGYFLAVPAAASVAADIFGGVADEKVVVGSDDAADGSKKVTAIQEGVFGFAKGAITKADIGAAAYASDDDTISTTSTNNLWVGYIVDVDDTYVYVDISDAAMMTNAAT